MALAVADPQLPDLVLTDGQGEGSVRFVIARDGRMLGRIAPPDKDRYGYAVEIFGPASLRYYIGPASAEEYALQAAAFVLRYEAATDELSQIQDSIRTARAEYSAVAGAVDRLRNDFNQLQAQTETARAAYLSALQDLRTVDNARRFISQTREES